MKDQLTVKDILKFIGDSITKTKFKADMSSSPMYWAGYIDGLLEVEEFILRVNSAFKQVAEYETDVSCDLCGHEFTAEIAPKSGKATCPVCQNKVDVHG